MKATNRGIVRIVSLSLLLLTVALPSAAGVVEVGPAKDNTLYESDSGANSNGAGQHFFAGVTAFNEKRRGVLAFDIAAAVPAGATINSVSLTLHMSKTIAGETPVSLYKLVSDWGESTSDAGGEEGIGDPAAAGDATWIHTFSPGSNWTNVGGDFVRTDSATESVGPEGFSYTWSTPAMAADVQGWLDNPAGNFGWIVIGDESESVTAKRFDTREHPDESRRPVLSIDFTPGDVPATSNLGVALLAALGLLIGSAFLLRRGPIADR